ncbi:glycosyltransferase, group 1 family protein [Leptospira inadai serovar Lyme str. 10]|uniref:Glycosyltransferase, group 1 family protein n=2 Tax=Leptospira inadai serovar Lyme TaxID=293084 RepID=V6H8H1_9LEPT|nr:glycosyltransferase [Leptospira inadai]EQA35216.1 glycosyltransferase, group 1 family protein [Leptospira inadai serovar Lyme str. 10]PNV73088.1 glycosyl transferase [Leptospira inadai serovar Lyme]
MKVYQHITEFRDYDGIGNDMKGISSTLDSIQIPSEIVCLSNFSSADFSIRNFWDENWREYENRNQVHILQYGGPGYPLDDFLALPGKKFVRFQNVTPPIFFKPFVEEDLFHLFALEFKRSILELHKLSRSVEAFIPSSKYSASNLEDLNIMNSKVLPIVRKYRWAGRNDRRRNGYTLGFVGRIAPNKKVEDLLLLIYFLKRINNKYRILICGSVPVIFDKYFSHLKRMTWDLGLGENVQFRMSPNDHEMVRFWDDMDAYVSMSEHEGFGIPLVEALSKDLPVFAYSCTSVPETLRGGGFLFRNKDLSSLRKLAEWIHLVLQTEGSGNPLPGEGASVKRREVVEEYNSIPFDRFFKQLLTVREPSSSVH